MAKKTRQVANKSARRQERKQDRKDKQEINVYAPVEFNPRTEAQKIALQLIAEHDMTFLLGAAGSGKTFLAMAYAINQVLTKQVEKIVLTRPIVEAGEKLGFLPGTFGEKVNPYMQPLYDTMELMLGKQSAKREIINKAVVLAPLCYMRGRTFNDSICIFDEAQNATYTQLKLFLTRFGQNTKVIVTGDPSQSDLYEHARDNYCALSEVVERLDKTPGIGVYEFEPQDVVRHKLVAAILRKL
jgi:phosphate starvation-inducible PhoH-like protein